VVGRRLPGRTSAELQSVSPEVAYTTAFGRMVRGLAEDSIASGLVAGPGEVQLVLTSPPFPLKTKKRYGNLQGQQYIDWLASFAGRLKQLLTPDGSIVLELGNAWEPGEPTMSTLPLRALLAFLDVGEFELCQQFICHNPARLPGPAQWVNIERIRAKDSFTHVWWMSATARPKADNRRVLREYSGNMKSLLRRQKYNAGLRPSDHRIGATSFLADNGGAIPSNVLSFSNTASTDPYQKYCRAHGLRPHPARMPMALASFFVDFLTEPGDLVYDPFAGSNTTGAAAETVGRRWVATEPLDEYVLGSQGRFAAGVAAVAGKQSEASA
jgi:DNA methylase